LLAKQKHIKIFATNEQVSFENVRKRLKTFENIRKYLKNDVKRSKIFDFFAGTCANDRAARNW
jgi:hypothetical protein